MRCSMSVGVERRRQPRRAGRRRRATRPAARAPRRQPPAPRRADAGRGEPDRSAMRWRRIVRLGGATSRSSAPAPRRGAGESARQRQSDEREPPHAARRPRASERRPRDAAPPRPARSDATRPRRGARRRRRRSRPLRATLSSERPAMIDRRDLHQLRPPFGQVERLRMRLVVRVAVRPAEEDVVDAELAGLHRGVARMRVAGADDPLRPEAIRPRARRSLEPGPDLHAVGLARRPARRVSSATSAAAPASWMIGDERRRNVLGRRAFASRSAPPRRRRRPAPRASRAGKVAGSTRGGVTRKRRVGFGCVRSWPDVQGAANRSFAQP